MFFVCLFVEMRIPVLVMYTWIGMNRFVCVHLKRHNMMPNIMRDSPKEGKIFYV